MNKLVKQYITQERKDELKELSDIVLTEYCNTPQINLDILLKQLCISISYGHYGDSFDGLIEYNKKSFHIFCNLERLESKASHRTRFTIAHELGHYFIEEHRDALILGKMQNHCSFTEYQSNQTIEQEADYFASNLLLPEKKFIKMAKSKKLGINAILFLSKEFNTSITSTAIRYTSLDLAPCLLIKWTREGYQWKWISDSLRNSNFRKTIEVTTDLLKGSATEQALKSQGNDTIFENGTTASAWFPHVLTESYKNIIMIEQAISIGKYGVLTLLFPAPDNI